MMTLVVHEATLRLREPVAASTVVHDVRTSLFFELLGDPCGWSECAVASGAGVDATAPDVLGALADASWATAATPGARAARGAVRTAALDASLRRAGHSLASSLGVAAHDVGFAGVVGLVDPAEAARRAGVLVAAGATRVRVKVAEGCGADAVRAVLDAVGVPVVADANGAFHRLTDELRELAALPLAWIEEPFAEGTASGAIAALLDLGAAIGADESVTSVGAIDLLASLGVTATCVKASRLGVPEALAGLRRATALGLTAAVGGYFEAGLGRAALGALSAAAANVDGDVVAPATYLVEDPCGLERPDRGRQPLYSGEGTGPLPLRAALTERHRIELPRELVEGVS